MTSQMKDQARRSRQHCADLCAQLWTARSRGSQHCIAEDIALARAQLVACPHLLHAGGYAC